MEHSISYKHDTDWDVQVVSYASDTKWSSLKKAVIDPGLVCMVDGYSVFYHDVLGYWVPMFSKPAALRIAQIAGAKSATVSYYTAFEPYVPKLTKALFANIGSSMPLSVCIGSRRLRVDIDKSHKRLSFYPCNALLPKRVTNSELLDKLGDLCIMPTLHVKLPLTYTFNGYSKMLHFLSPMFPAKKDLVTFCWIIGNAICDPVRKTKSLFLCGPGGTGKSTLIRCIYNTLGLCSTIIRGNMLSIDNQHKTDDVLASVIGSRVVLCSELDFSQKNVNIELIKTITGNDYIAIAGATSKTSCSLIVGSNNLPDTKTHPEFLEDAMIRRCVYMKMLVDTISASESPDPDDQVVTLDFLCYCIYVRLLYDAIPMTPDTLLLSLCGDRYFETRRHVRFVETDGDVINISDGRQLVGIISAILECSLESVTHRCYLISPGSVVQTPMGDIIKGMIPAEASMFD